MLVPLQDCLDLKQGGLNDLDVVLNVAGGGGGVLELVGGILNKQNDAQGAGGKSDGACCDTEGVHLGASMVKPSPSPSPYR